MSPKDRLPAAGGSVLAEHADTGGAFTLIRATVPPGDATPLHRHLDMDESFYVLRVTPSHAAKTRSRPPPTTWCTSLRESHTSTSQAQTVARRLILATPGGLETFFDDWESGMDVDELRRRHRIEFLE